ncbi:MAG TPA: hypothetical protein VF223_05080 [Trebonia sp.]
MERSETTAGHVPLPRPYVDRAADPTQYPAPVPPQPRFIPRQEGPAPQQASARRPVRRYVRPERSVIGDELRIPIMWCEFGTCIERYTHVDALGEQDLRYRALVAGWRYDLLGRLACPSCVQHDEMFWMTRPPVPAQRYRR